MNPTRATRNSSPAASEPVTPEVDVRPLETHAERDACVRLQRAIWGPGYGDMVPASILKVSQGVGGVAAGAFAGDGELVGFVYGITGVREGRLTHWSHMLGVLGSHRGQGIGQRLKFFQRDRVVSEGVPEMRWTFDPLVSGNAHFNLNLLGVEIRKYVADMYGDTGSGMHSFGTDRFIAHWNLAETREVSGSEATPTFDWDSAPLLNADPACSEPVPPPDSTPHAVRIVVPYDILALNRKDPELAAAWRHSTRTAFVRTRREGFGVVGFSRSRDAGRGHYFLTRSTSAGTP